VHSNSSLGLDIPSDLLYEDLSKEMEIFADAVVSQWTSADLWQKISRNGLKNLAGHFSVEAAAKPIDELLAWAGLRTTACN
jgi:hypothetical protein